METNDLTQAFVSIEAIRGSLPGVSFHFLNLEQTFSIEPAKREAFLITPSEADFQYNPGNCLTNKKSTT
jgi:hypothetical protein